MHLPLLQLSGHSVLSLHINIKFILCLLVLSPPYSFCLGIPVLLFLLKTALLLRFIRPFLLLVFLILGLSRSFFPSRCSLLSILWRCTRWTHTDTVLLKSKLPPSHETRINTRLSFLSHESLKNCKCQCLNSFWDFNSLLQWELKSMQKISLR